MRFDTFTIKILASVLSQYSTGEDAKDTDQYFDWFSILNMTSPSTQSIEEWSFGLLLTSKKQAAQNT